MKVVLFKSWSDSNDGYESVIRPGIIYNGNVIPLGSNQKTFNGMRLRNELVVVPASVGIKKNSAVQWDFAKSTDDVQIVKGISVLPDYLQHMVRAKYRKPRGIF